MTLLPVMSGEDLPYNRPTSPQSSLSGGVMFGCIYPVQVLLHIVCHCEDDQLSVRSPWSGIFLLRFFYGVRRSCYCLNDRSTGACSLIVYGSLNTHGKQCINCEVIWIFTHYLWKTGSWKRDVSFFAEFIYIYVSFGGKVISLGVHILFPIYTVNV
jgi:hypothetical protein